MTTYLGEKAVGVGTVKATMNVGKVITDKKTVLGDGFTEPLAVNTLLFATTEGIAASADALRAEMNNKIAVVNASIDGVSEAVAKTRNDSEIADQEIRADMNEKDAELEHMITEHAEELTTLRGNQASLGDQVAGIEEKIPESASGTNHLITKQQLLDEEMDIRDDLNEGLSELQTQITAQAAKIANKQDKLTAGENITIEDGVISATGGGASLPDQTGNSGKFLTTDGSEVSWGKAFANKSTHLNAIAIGYDKQISTWTNDIYIGTPNTKTIGKSVGGIVVIGADADTLNSSCFNSIAIGNNAKVGGEYAIQLGMGQNNDDNTFKVGTQKGNFEMMDANGNVPLDRLTYVTDQIGDISTALTAILGE